MFNEKQIRAKRPQNQTSSQRTRKSTPINTSLLHDPLPDEQTPIDNTAHPSFSLAHLPIFPPSGADDNTSHSFHQSNPGAVMDAATSDKGSKIPYREEMEQVFHEDFSTVKSHLGQSAKIASLGAYAATRGEHIVFAGTRPSRKEVAHELVHIMQNRRSSTLARSDNTVTASDHPAEYEAENLAPQIVAGRSAVVTAQPGGAISLGKYKVNQIVILSETYGGRTGKIIKLGPNNTYDIILTDSKLKLTELEEDEIKGLADASGDKQSSGPSRSEKNSNAPRKQQDSDSDSGSEEEANISLKQKTKSKARQTSVRKEKKSDSDSDEERKEQPQSPAIATLSKKKGGSAHAQRGHFLNEEKALKGQATQGKDNFTWSSEDEMNNVIARAQEIKGDKKVKLVEVDIEEGAGYGVKHIEGTYYRVYPTKARVVFRAKGDVNTAYGITEKPIDDKQAYHKVEEIDNPTKGK